MAYNGNGIYVLPTGQPVATNTVISSATFNAYTADVGITFNNTLPRDGQAAMTGQLKLMDGTVTSPGIAYNGESSTGFYRPGTGILAATVQGSEAFRLVNGRLLVATATDDGSSKLQVSGNAAVSGNTSVGGTLNVTGSTTIAGGLNNTPIGATTPNTGNFTSINSTNAFNSVKATLSAASGYNGFQVADQGGNRKLELYYLGTGQGGAYGAAQGSAVINAAGTAGLTLSTNDTAALVINGSGNVGIGTAPNAVAKLFTNGGLYVQGPATLPASIGTGLFSFENPVFREYVGDGTGYSRAFSKRSSGVTTDLMTIADSGGVGVGKVASGGFTLDVNNNARASQWTVYDTSGASNRGQFYYNSGALKLEANGPVPIAFATNGGEVARLDSGGNLGINTTAPAAKVDISVAGGMLRIGSGSGNNLIQTYSSGGTLGLWAGGSSQIYSNGGIGFVVGATTGTTSPTGGSTALTLASGGNAVFGGAVTAPTFFSTNAEAFRVENDTGYLSFFNSANGIRTGYIQGNTGADVRMAADGSNSLILMQGATQRVVINTVGVSTQGLLTVVNSAGTNYNENLRMPRAADGYSSLSMACDTSGAGSIAGQFNVLVYPSATTGSATAAGPGGMTLRANGTDALTIGTNALCYLTDGNEVGYKGLPQNIQSTSYTLVYGDRGKHIYQTNFGVTVPASVFNIGDVVTIVNASGSTMLLTQGSGVTMYQQGTTATGNRTIAVHGIATVLCTAANNFFVGGNVT